MGKMFCKNLDRDLPATNFGKGVSGDRKLMGKQYRGVFLLMAYALHSTKGRSILMRRKTHFGGKNGIKDWSLVVELLLEWEAFLCLPKMRRDGLVRLKRKHKTIMKYILKVCPRTTGNQMKFFKFHAILHIVADILLYGVPLEVDTGSNESHHKPSKQVSVCC